MVVVAKDKRQTTAFGKRLKVLRTAAELTQATLAAKAQMEPSVLARLERGENEPTWPTVLKLAKALGVTTDAFTSDDDTDEKATPKKPRK